MKNNISMTTLIGSLVVLVVAAGFLLAFLDNTKQQRIAGISSFEECAAAGYPIMESYPEQCMTPDGRLFVRDVSPINPAPIVSNGCVVGGCSSQLCISEEEYRNGGGASTCEWTAAYACYQNATCEPQSNGMCGWTDTTQLRQCLANPPPIE